MLSVSTHEHCCVILCIRHARLRAHLLVDYLRMGGWQDRHEIIIPLDDSLLVQHMVVRVMTRGSLGRPPQLTLRHRLAPL